MQQRLENIRYALVDRNATGTIDTIYFFEEGVKIGEAPLAETIATDPISAQRIDLDGDGTAESLSVRRGSGDRADFIVQDMDGDGQFDLVYIDSDGNGDLDTLCTLQNDRLVNPQTIDDPIEAPILTQLADLSETEEENLRGLKTPEAPDDDCEPDFGYHDPDEDLDSDVPMDGW